MSKALVAFTHFCFISSLGIMEIFFAIILAALVSYILISTALGHNPVVQLFRVIGQLLLPRLMTPTQYAYSLQNKISVWQLRRKLKKIDYFSSFTAAEQAAFLKNLKAVVHHENDFEPQLRHFLFEKDKRSFVVDYYDDLVIDAIGYVDKWDGLRAGNASGFTTFYDYLLHLGLEVKLEIVEVTDVEQECDELFRLIINGNVYDLLYEAYDEEGLCDQLVITLNGALEEIGAGERLYIIDSYPTVLIFLNQKQYNYLYKKKRRV